MVWPIWASGRLQDRRDRAALIVGRDRRVASPADRHAQDSLLQEGQLPGIEQPLQEVGRPQMDDVEARPVEHLLGDEAVATGVALRFPARRPLGQVDDRRDARFLRGLGEVDGRRQKPGLDRPDEIGRVDALHRGTDRVDLQEIAGHDLGAGGLQGLRPRILLVHHRPHVEADGESLLHGGAAGIAGGAAYQDLPAHIRNLNGEDSGWPGRPASESSAATSHAVETHGGSGRRSERRRRERCPGRWRRVAPIASGPEP